MSLEARRAGGRAAVGGGGGSGRGMGSAGALQKPPGARGGPLRRAAGGGKARPMLTVWESASIRIEMKMKEWRESF